MVNRITLVLSGMIAVVLLMMVVVLFPFSGSVVDEKVDSVVNSKSLNGEVEQVMVVGEDYSYEGGCYEGIYKVSGEGNCNYPSNQKKRCYREITVGCNTRLSEVSCFEQTEQVNGEGYCFNVQQLEKRCYNGRVSGCNEILTETSCFDGVEQAGGEGSCDCPEQNEVVCDGRERRGICGSF